MAAKEAKAAPSDEEVKFLMTVIKVGGIGSIEWQKVADAMGIVSKAAASKRFSRLNLKYKDILDIVATTDGDEDGSKTPASESPKKKAAPKNGGAKKRKLEEAAGDDEASTVKGEAEDEN